MTLELGSCWGECPAKSEHIAGVPVRPATAERLHFVYLAKGDLATTAMEGKKLPEDAVIRHLEGQLRLPPSVVSADDASLRSDEGGRHCR